MPFSTDTIFALATPPGRSGVAVVRLSGPQVEQTITALGLKELLPRQAQLKTLRHPATGEAIDRGLVLYFPAPHSFTGESVLEAHLHGSRAVLSEFFEALAQLPQHRPAEAGEFSRRAFLNGKLDLSEIEGLADLIDAETAAQKKQAMRQMEGALSDVADRLRRGLLHSLALLEAFIDFPNEDLPPEIGAEAEQGLMETRNEIARWLGTASFGEQLREGWQVTILGVPNAGKSTLLNWIAGKNAAIVSPEEGTTRDIVEVTLNLGGWPVTLCDTAGLRVTDNIVEKEGIRRALERSAHSELRLILLDSTRPLAWQEEILREALPNDIILVAKTDLLRHPAFFPPEKALFISAATQTGLDRLLEKLHLHFDRFDEKLETSLLTRARHRQAFAEALQQIDHAFAAQPLELRAEHVRLACVALGSIMGRVTSEDLLDVIFSQFCLGK